jgi:hypothetical protein
MPSVLGNDDIPICVIQDLANLEYGDRINTAGSGRSANATDVSRGIFGATVGLDRLLAMLRKHNIKATFFTPAHTAESFPEQMAIIRDESHEM